MSRKLLPIESAKNCDPLPLPEQPPFAPRTCICDKVEQHESCSTSFFQVYVWCKTYVTLIYALTVGTSV